MTEDERALVEEMGRKGQVIVRDRSQPVSGLGMLMPAPAAVEVQEKLPYVFNVNHFVAAYKRLGARPAKGAANPDHTIPDWCVYDEPTRSYRYTRAYVKHLGKRCSTPEGFREVTGMEPRLKDPPAADQRQV